MAKTYLFLDDLRPVPEGYIGVRNYKEFVKYIEEDELPHFISFDHDLGGGKTGYDCAKWLVEYCLERWLPLPEFSVHSQNPVGRLNISAHLANYIKNFKQTFKAEFLSGELEMENIRIQKSIRLKNKQYEELELLKVKEKDLELNLLHIPRFAQKLWNEMEPTQSNFDEIVELSKILSYYDSKNSILKNRILDTIGQYEKQKDKAVVMRNFELWKHLREEINFLKRKMNEIQN